VQSPLSRDGVGNVTAQLTDAGAGVDPASARLSAPGMAPVPALPTANAGEFRVAWDASRPTFRAFEGPVTLTLEAADRLGHRAARNADVTITRRLFVFEKPAAGAITSSPAVAAGLVYFGSEDFRAYAVDRRSGAKRWEFPTGGRVTASPAVGADRIYVASEDGRLYAVKPDGTEAWRCPGSSTLGMLSSSPAIGTTDGEETVFLTSGTSRASYAMRGSGFVVDAAIPEAKACLRSIARGGGGRSSVALDGTGGAFVGEATATGGKLVKLTFAKAADGVWSFTDDWSFSAADQVHSSPALRAGGSVLFGSDDRRMYEVSGGTQLWSAAALGRVSGSPSLGASASYFIDEAGRAFALRLSDGAPAWDAAGIPVAEAPVRTAPAVGEDGTVYITAGSKLQARAPDGTLLWEYDAGGSVDGSSPALACDGAVYFGAGGKLHALITDSRGLAGSAWPKFRHDNHNTGNAATPVRAGPTCTD
jgi:outer membrane protein assembly factor BamB